MIHQLPRARTFAVLAAIAVAGATLEAQRRSTAPARPIPYPLMESRRFERAVANGTRSRDGRPGPKYWQQHATYVLEAALDPATATLSGRGRIRYENRSPDSLADIYLHLYANLFAPEAARAEEVPVTGGLQLGSVRVNGSPLAPRRWPDSTVAGHAIRGTILRIRLPAPLGPGQPLELELAWSYVVPPDGAPRGGHDDDTWMLSYWYPQMAVYDDVVGWQIDPYLANAEFYMGFADYDVSLTVPAGWLVGATGTLVNAREVLPPGALARLDSARATGRLTRVAAASDAGAPRARATWRWRTRAARDFAWATSPRYVWDAVAASAGDIDGDGRADSTLVHALYRPGRPNWEQAAAYGRHSVEFLSRFLWPYPWPHMTIIDGVDSCSGMEYPMLTCIGRERDTLDLYGVIVHEIGHMWFPMQVGSDEKRHSWQDEGLTRFNQAEAMRDFFRGYDRLETSRRNYFRIVRAGDEVELMRHGDLYPPWTTAFSVASYDKMALTLRMLRAVLGEDLFLRAYSEYGTRWRGRHPVPDDFFNTFESVAGRDLDWFWRTWFHETWPLDQAIVSVRRRGGSTDIEIEDRGLAPMPVRLTLTRPGDAIEHVEVPVDVWLTGKRRHILRVRGTVTMVEIDAGQEFIDVDRGNNVWPGKGSGVGVQGSDSRR